MLYDETLKKVVLDVLENRVSGIANCITGLNELGYTPNKSKLDILGWVMILIDAYENIDIFSEEQQHNLDIINNKVLNLWGKR